MDSASEYRYLAGVCRDRAAMRVRPEDRKTMLGAAAEFDRMAAEAEAKEKAVPVSGRPPALQSLSDQRQGH